MSIWHSNGDIKQAIRETNSRKRSGLELGIINIEITLKSTGQDEITCGVNIDRK